MRVLGSAATICKIFRFRRPAAIITGGSTQPTVVLKFKTFQVNSLERQLAMPSASVLVGIGAEVQEILDNASAFLIARLLQKGSFAVVVVPKVIGSPLTEREVVKLDLVPLLQQIPQDRSRCLKNTYVLHGFVQ